MATAREEPGRPPTSGFTGRIDRRLSVVFAALFTLVLLVGGASLSLLGSLLLESGPIARQSTQVHVVERVHTTFLRYLSAIQLAHVQGTLIPDTVRSTYATRLESLVTLYRAGGGAPEDVQEMRQLIAEAGRLGEGVGGRERGAAAHEPDGVHAIQQRMEALADRVSAGHEATEQRQVRLTRQTLRLTIGVNIAFVVVGTGLLLAAQRYFHRAIAVPLRQLADGATAIASGDVSPPMPVTSTDEIGRLSHAFNRMARQLREHEERLKGLITLEERQRLARELHDSLAQDLAVLRLKLIEAEQSLGPDVSTETKTLVREMFTSVDAGYQNLREAIFGLRALEGKIPAPLIASLREYLSDFSAIRKISVELQVSGPETLVLPPQAATQLIRIVHEALSNIVRHSGASKATVTVEREPGMARITIADDGRGFVVETAAEDARHFGLQTMKDRAEVVGGTLVVQSSPGHGTHVILELPTDRG
jgi:nitrate/nitrite-specific signal transduction histidine kinase